MKAVSVNIFDINTSVIFYVLNIILRDKSDLFLPEYFMFIIELFCP